MTNYISKSGKQSGVIAYSIDQNSITVVFKEHTYKYTVASAGIAHIENMKRCAIASQGLSTYIAQNKPKYEVKY